MCQSLDSLSTLTYINSHYFVHNLLLQCTTNQDAYETLFHCNIFNIKKKLKYQTLSIYQQKLLLTPPEFLKSKKCLWSWISVAKLSDILLWIWDSFYGCFSSYIFILCIWNFFLCESDAFYINLWSSKSYLMKIVLSLILKCPDYS